MALTPANRLAGQRAGSGREMRQPGRSEKIVRYLFKILPALRGV